MPDELPPISPDLVGELTRLVDAVAERDDHADLAARLEWLVDTLILRDQLPASFRRLADKIKAGGDRSVVRLATFRDKYAVASPDVDCASLIPLCGARCCSFEVTLSAQDVVEGGVPFDVMRPYAMAKANGTCACRDATGACTIYDKRPGACRAYDCRHDRRVWIDFENRIPAPPREP
jgi:hypothetical protein